MLEVTLRHLRKILRLHYYFQRCGFRVQRKIDSRADAVERETVRNQIFDGQLAAENQVRGFFLQIDIGAVGTEDGPLADTHVRAGKLDSLLMRSLREQQNAAAGARAFDRLLNNSRGGRRYDC